MSKLSIASNQFKDNLNHVTEELAQMKDSHDAIILQAESYRQDYEKVVKDKRCIERALQDTEKRKEALQLQLQAANSTITHMEKELVKLKEKLGINTDQKVPVAWKCNKCTFSANPFYRKTCTLCASDRI